MGPNGGLLWTDAAVDRTEPYAGAAFSTAKKSPEPVPVDTESTVIVRPEEPAGSSVHAALEAPMAN